MAFNAYTGSTGSMPTPLTSPRDPSGQRGSSRTLSFTGGLDQAGTPTRRKLPKRGSGPGVRRRGTPPPPIAASLSPPAMMPQSRLSPEGGIPGVEDIGQAAAMGRVPGVGQPGVMGRLGASPRRKGQTYRA